jgi:SAM-dependent methyltransferase
MPMMNNDVVDEINKSRLAREKAFHNDRAVEETRQAQGKFYASLKLGALNFEKTLFQLATDVDILEYGSGDFPIMLHNEYSFSKTSLAEVCRYAVGIDISDVAVAKSNEKAAALGIANANFQVMNAEEMSFPDASFDLVFGRGIIHHLDIEKSLSEISRVLRPNGTALFWEPLGHNFLLNFYRRLTPNARTEDEHPLMKTDFKLIEKFFGNMDLTFCGFTTIATVPIRDTTAGDTMLSVLSQVDKMLFKLPKLKWQAWHVMMNLTSPK